LINTNLSTSSNYTKDASNVLNSIINANLLTSSNYTKDASNVLNSIINANLLTSSNYTKEASNILQNSINSNLNIINITPGMGLDYNTTTNKLLFNANLNDFYVNPQLRIKYYENGGIANSLIGNIGIQIKLADNSLSLSANGLSTIGSNIKNLDYNNIGLNKLTFTGPLSSNISTNEITIDLIPTLTTSSNYTINTSNDLLTKINANYLLKTGGTITGTLNATTNLQENGTNLSAKYLSLTGGTLTNLLTGTIINATTNLQENGTNLSAKYLSLTGGTLTNLLTGTTINATTKLQIDGTDINNYLFNNTGKNHGTYTDFNAIDKFGYSFIQGSTNSPNTHTELNQYYSWYIGLGNEYPFVNGIYTYGAQFGLPRNATNPTLSIRFKESGTWSSWSAITAGKAEALTTGDKTVSGVLTATSFSGNGSALTNLTYNNIDGKPSTFPADMTSIYNKTETDTLLNAKEAILTFSSPLTRTTNTIGINLSTYSTTGTDTNYLLKTGGTLTGNFNIEKSSPIFSIKSTAESQTSILYLSTPLNTSSGLKTAIISQGLSSWGRSKLHFCLNDNQTDNSTAQNATVSHARMTILPTGNIGINNTAPSEKLDVNGNVKGTAFYGDGANLTNLNYNNIGLNKLTFAAPLSSNILTNEITIDLTPTLTTSSNYTINTSNDLLTKINTNYLLKTGGTLTNLLTGTIINATTNLQENGTNLSAKYLSLTGGTLTNLLTGTIINATTNLQENGTDLSAKYLSLTGTNSMNNNTNINLSGSGTFIGKHSGDGSLLTTLNYNNIGLNKLTFTGPLSSNIATNEITINLTPTLTTSSNYTINTSNDLLTKINTNYLLKTGGTLTNLLTGTIINATTNLQENGTNLSAKYLSLTGGVLTGALSLVNDIWNKSTADNLDRIHIASNSSMILKIGNHETSKFIIFNNAYQDIFNITSSGVINDNKITVFGGAIKFNMNTWNKSADGLDRILFSSNANMYFRAGAGETVNNSAFNFFDNGYQNLFQIKTTGDIITTRNIDCGGGISLTGSTAFINTISPDAANLTNTYINFKGAGAGTDWCYLRQIGTNEAIKLALDFHDDIDARFCIRYNTSTAQPDTVVEVFTVDNGNVSMTGNCGIGISGQSQKLYVNGTSYLNGDTTIEGNLSVGTAVNKNFKLNCFDNNHFIYMNQQNNILQIQEYGTINFTVTALQTQILSITSSGVTGTTINATTNLQENGTNLSAKYLSLAGANSMNTNTNINLSGSGTFIGKHSGDGSLLTNLNYNNIGLNKLTFASPLSSNIATNEITIDLTPTLTTSSNYTFNTSNNLQYSINSNLLLSSNYTNNTSNNLLGLITKSNYSIERQYPPKTADIIGSSTTFTYNGFTAYYVNFTLNSANINYGYGSYTLTISNKFTYAINGAVDNYRLFDYIINQSNDNSADFLDITVTNFDPANGNYIGTRYLATTSYKGEYFFIKLCTAIILTKYVIYGNSTYVARNPALWKIYGSTDGLIWEEIVEASNNTRLSSTDYSNNSYIYIKTLSTPSKLYNYFGMCISAIIANTELSFIEFQIFGQEVLNSIDTINTTITNINNNLEYSINSNLLLSSNYTFNTSNNLLTNIITNYNTIIYNTNEKQFPPRLYDTTSSETLLTVAEITCFPSLCYKQILTLNNHGNYIIYSSSTDSINYKNTLFDYNISITAVGAHWYYSGSTGPYTANNGTYNGANYINSDYKGDWIIVKLPYKIVLSRFRFYHRIYQGPHISRAPGLWICYGSNDGITFTEITEASNKITSMTAANYSFGYYEKQLNTTFNIPYQYIGWTVNKLVGGDANAFLLNFQELQIFGKDDICNSYSKIWTNSSNNIIFDNPQTLTTYTSTTSSINLTNTYIKFNYTDELYFASGSYIITFGNGNYIINTTPTISNFSYPLLKDSIFSTINPIIWYKFDTNYFLNDDGSLFNGSLTSITPATNNTVIFCRGSGSAYFLGSSSQFLTIPSIIDFNLINIVNGISFSLWVNINTTSTASSKIFAFGELTNCIMIYKNAANATTVFEIISSSVSTSYTTTITVIDNTWKHIVWTISTTGLWTIYINNTLINPVKTKLIPSMGTKTYNLGKSLDVSPIYMTMYMDDFRIYNKVLSTPEVSELYNGRVDVYKKSNIGIGTTNPISLLDVRGNTTIMGNIGIGTTNPISLLDVRGTSIFTGNVGIGTTQNTYNALTIQGRVNIHNGSPYAISSANGMQNGSLTIGDTLYNYGGGTGGWSTNTAGLLLECADNTEIAVHDNGTRLTSLLYYQGSTNSINIGRNMGSGFGPANITISGPATMSIGANPLTISSTTPSDNNCIRFNNNASKWGYIGLASSSFGGNYQNNLYFESAGCSMVFNSGTRTTLSIPSMILTTAGNIGIGITNPFVPLMIGSPEVDGSDGSLVIAKKVVGTTGTNFKLGFDSNLNFIMGTYGTTTTIANNTQINNFMIEKGAYTNSLLLKSSGNVDIVPDVSSSATQRYCTIGGLRLAGWDTTNTIYNANILGLGAIGNILLNTGTTTGNLATKMVIDTSGNVGIGSIIPKCKLDINGIVNINNGNGFAITQSTALTAGSLIVGGTNVNYGGKTDGWTTGNIAGILLECLENTEIAVHDSGDKLASLIYYNANTITIGRNMGHSSISQIYLSSNVMVYGDILTSNINALTSVQVNGTNISDIYLSSNLLPNIQKKYSFNVICATSIILNGTTYYKYDIDLTKYTIISNTLRSFKINCFIANGYFNLLSNNLPRVCNYEIYMANKTIAGGTGELAGINICATGTPENYNLNKIPLSYIFLLRTDNFNYISIISTVQNTSVNCIISDNLN
jgi:hypothetical protein